MHVQHNRSPVHDRFLDYMGRTLVKLYAQGLWSTADGWLLTGLICPCCAGNGDSWKNDSWNQCWVFTVRCMHVGCTTLGSLS